MLLILIALAVSATSTMPSTSVRTMIRDARKIVSYSGEAVWPGYSRISIPVQLIEPTREILFCGRSATGFRRLTVDRVTGCGLQVRARQLPVDRAAATYLDEQPVIQIGLPGARRLRDRSGSLRCSMRHSTNFRCLYPVTKMRCRQPPGRSIGMGRPGCLIIRFPMRTKRYQRHLPR